MLFSPEAHESPTDAPWSAGAAQAAIDRIVASAESAFANGWPLHPLDDDGDLPLPPRSVYLGGAGVIDALHRLDQRGFSTPRHDYVAYLEASLDAAPDFPDEDAQRSLWMGEAGIRLVLQRLAPSAGNRTALARLIAANAHDERCELMWGSPGTILAGRELGVEITESLDWLRAARGADGLWTQRLYGRVDQYLGPAHGFAGCALALDEPEGIAAALRHHAVREANLANWPARAGSALDANGDGLIRTQWCHGAPGIVATIAHLLDDDLALAGGELTWVAGPLAKGAGLCHGTAGNGYAFLALLARSGDERWLARARAFAMHAVLQVEQARARHGCGRHTLWTGDLGTALYLADCIDGGGRLPLP